MAAFNASEAPAVMGASKYISRSGLLRQKATGIAPEVSPQKQALFDRGHAVEGPTIAMIEEVLGDSLAPVVASILIDGMTIGASYDGLSLMEDAAGEVKLWNEDLARQIQSGDLDPHYYWQLEQQFIVTPTLERIVFATSDGTPERFVHMEYRPVPGRREALLSNWKQFAEDLANYRPAEAQAAVTATPTESLPAVAVQVQGALTIASNLPLFGQKLRAFVATIPAKPTSDQDFADCEAACKALKKAEEALDGAERGALAQITSVEELTRTVADLRKLARDTRLASEKVVKIRKDQIRAEEVARGRQALADHIAALNARLGKPYMPAIPADFAAVISGLKKLDSLRDAIDTELARAKIAANEIADRIQVNLQALRELASEHAFLFADTAQLVLKAADDCRAVITSRIAEHRAAEQRRLEAERERIRQEEEAKLRREQEAREAAERRQREEAERQAAAEQRRQEAERAEQARQAAEAAKPAQAPAPEPVAAPAVIQQAPNVVPIARPAADARPHVRLGQINERLAPISLTADGLASLGFHPVATEKAAKLYRAVDVDRIPGALIAHLQSVQAAMREAA
jgi:predicted phage-related endonuclease